ncbi:hypothetical protein ASF98_14350 [Arthrobacter sp. Leaf337]|uniref:hypothetical protein n=1 Tax=Arthrobacter sp. Leaf337 TaxID=1736342 RepID=UPI0006F3C99F|nr:hypothetical protein [Arthrobacter sp. Leaf337]KQR62762.1 hypothetical protein ASF98_14350 [Arthrobacter sp. Leaf337]
MSEDNPEVPRNPPPPEYQGGPPQQPKRGSMGLGILFGTMALYAIYFGGLIAVGGPYAWSNSILAGPATFVPIALYLVGSILLALRPRTSRWGAGLLIGLGIFTLLGEGLCVGFLAQPGI